MPVEMTLDKVGVMIGTTLAGVAALLHVIFNHRREMAKIQSDEKTVDEIVNGGSIKEILASLLAEMRMTRAAAEANVALGLVTYKPRDWDAMVTQSKEVSDLAFEIRGISVKLLARARAEADKEA